MNAERLLAHYERIADATDAVARLRRFILDLAVRGKLVPQDPNGAPVAQRYERELGPDDLPAHWRVLNFGKFCDIEGGNQPPKSQFIHEPRAGYVQLLQIRDLGERPVPTYIPVGSTNRFCKEGEILIGRYGASVGKVFWAQNGAYNVAMAKFIWPLDAFISTFAFLVLKSDYLQRPLANATRSAQAGFNKGDLAAINFPLPPLAEQKRIVAKVDELMAFCDQLDKARAEREATRDRLAAASLARLNTPNPETFQDDARFALGALPAMTARPDQVKQLRQTILNLAVRGKLVPQDPKDEPASELLKRIAAEKARLVKAGEIRKQKPPSEIEPEHVPFGLPLGWEWSRLGAATVIVQGFAFSSGDFSIDPLVGYPLIKIGDIGSNAPDTYIKGEPDPAYLVKAGDILLGLSGSIKCSIWDGPEALLNQRIARIAPPSKDIHPVWLLFGVGACIDKWKDETSKLTVQNIKASQLYEAIIPLPPLAEQHRIVAKVDELMALCDKLEASLTAAADTRRRLLDALLAQALAPGEVHEWAGAE
jgi:type I restriction enzyme S subunit